MTHKTLENIAAVETVNEQTQVIGHLCWYSVGEDLYDREELRKSLLYNGLSETNLPNAIRPADAFRRATKDVEMRRVETDQEGVYENYIIRNVVSNDDIVQRNIVKETVDSKGARLDYVSEVEMTFDRKAETFNYSVTSGGMAEELAEEASKLFDIYLTHHNATAIRACAIKILQTMSPTPVRPSGGVYFVPAKHSLKLDCLVGFLRSFQKGEGQMIPLIDTEDNRDMVKQKLYEHLQRTLHGCNETLTNESLPKGQVRMLIEDAKRVVADFKDYREVITGAVDDMENHVDLIRQQIQLMMDRLS